MATDPNSLRDTITAAQHEHELAAIFDYEVLCRCGRRFPMTLPGASYDYPLHEHRNDAIERAVLEWLRGQRPAIRVSINRPFDLEGAVDGVLAALGVTGEHQRDIEPKASYSVRAKIKNVVRPVPGVTGEHQEDGDE
jgi:hypothetical protein